MSILAARDLSFSYGIVPTLSEVTLALPERGMCALIGPNGSGKTTLLKLLAGTLAPSRGLVEWRGVDARRYSRQEMARRIAMVPQQLNIAFGLTVGETVLLGRTPHLRPFSGPTRHDRRVAGQMMELAEIGGLAERRVTELSGGEKQRVVIAMALAQEPEVLLLDEPTVHLDINHQIEILELLAQLNLERDLTVLATMHDLNLASLYFWSLTMLKQGRVAATGTPEAVLSAERVREVFDATVQIQPHPARPAAPQVVLLPRA